MSTALYPVFFGFCLGVVVSVAAGWFVAWFMSDDTEGEGR